MSRTRHKPEPQARAISWTWSAAYTWPSRKNDWGQLIFASRGILTVATDAGIWIVPPHQAVWVPPGVTHSVKVGGGVAIRAVYLSTKLKRRLPRTCRVIELSPLLWELLRRTMKLATLDRRRAEERHLLDVILDQLHVLPVAPFDLPMPRDARGVRAATLVRESPAKRHRLHDVAKTSAASTRTLERLFRTETGLSFGAWRQRARLLRALELLAEGTTVTKTAIAVGYDSTSAFVAAFRRTLGKTPGRYFMGDVTRDPWSVTRGSSSGHGPRTTGNESP